MSFNNKNFWMSRDAGCLTDGKMGCGTSSKEEQKRHLPWDAAEEEIFCSKKQAAESSDSRPIPGTANMNPSLWGNSSSSGLGQFNDHHFVPESLRTINLAGNISSSGTGNLNTQRRGLLDQFGSDSAINLSMSHTVKDPFGLNGGVEEGNVSQDRNTMNAFSMAMGHPHTIGEKSETPSSTSYERNANSRLFQPAYGKEDRSTMSLCPSFSKANDNFISMGQTLGKGVGDFLLMGHQYNRASNNVLSVVQPFNKGSCGFVSLDQQYGVGNSNFMPDGPDYNKGRENFVTMDPSYGKSSESFQSMAPTFDKRDAIISSINPTHHKEDASTMSRGISFDGGNSSIIPMGHSFHVAESSIISFGPEANSSSHAVISSSDMATNQSSVQLTETTLPKDSTETNINQVTKVASNGKSDNVSKNKEPKKVTANNFPANVKSMLTTGIFDGVPVKYVSWSREKTLRGVIRGSGYLCGCDDCKFSKVLNAYEFERHAGCKTKHPNSHIYFENGKTVYSVVQELKSTPQEKLFGAIQHVTGSPINQKNFRSWKVSYQAATRELERIYGKDEAVVQS